MHQVHQKVPDFDIFNGLDLLNVLILVLSSVDKQNQALNTIRQILDSCKLLSRYLSDVRTQPFLFTSEEEKKMREKE